ncbi:MAG: hypothetical protein VX090_02820 [Pseudomonadota bacterium]|nr:hypothetical protein [Pseudomonadota bacterium]
MSGKAPSGSHCAAIVEPYLSGKTSLLEALLQIREAIPRLGSIKEGNTVGDPSDGLRGIIWQSELHDLTINLRSQTMGIRTFLWSFDHMAELIRRAADDVIK